MGDVNTTLIRTVKGRTIVLQYDVTTPRPYSRHQTVCGTKGFMQKYPVPCILLDEYGKEPLAGEDFEKVMERYKHPFTATIGEEAKRKDELYHGLSSGALLAQWSAFRSGCI